MSLTIDQARAGIAELRDELGLTNRDFARAFQDRVSVDAFVDFMNGDDTALTDQQQVAIGMEAASLAAATNEEQAKRLAVAMGFSQ